MSPFRHSIAIANRNDSDLTIDLRDAVGDRLHLNNDFAKEGVSWSANRLLETNTYPTDSLQPRTSCINEVSAARLIIMATANQCRLGSSTKVASVSELISSAKRRTPNQKSSLSGLRALFTSRDSERRHAAYRATHDKVDNGPACRIYGSVEVKKVTANLHITSLGHGYVSYEHTDHACE